jgi:hypothetical protein
MKKLTKIKRQDPVSVPRFLVSRQAIGVSMLTALGLWDSQER